MTKRKTQIFKGSPKAARKAPVLDGEDPPRFQGNLGPDAVMSFGDGNEISDLSGSGFFIHKGKTSSGRPIEGIGNEIERLSLEKEEKEQLDSLIDRIKDEIAKGNHAKLNYTRVLLLSISKVSKEAFGIVLDWLIQTDTEANKAIVRMAYELRKSLR